MTTKTWVDNTANELMDTLNDKYLCCQIQHPEMNPEQFLNEVRAMFDALAADWKEEMLDEYYKDDDKDTPLCPQEWELDEWEAMYEEDKQND